MPPSSVGRDGGHAALAGWDPAKSIAGGSAPALARSRTPTGSPSTRPRGTASTGMLPISEPNGSNNGVDGADWRMVNPRAISPLHIFLTAADGHGEKMIFF